MLLVLDNFEQLAADASILEKLLHACPRLKIIVTSRVRLAVAMEWLLPLEGLPCPGGRGSGPLRSVRCGAPVCPGGPACRARLGPVGGGRVDRRYLPAGRGIAAGAGACGGMDAGAVLRCDRRRAASGNRASAGRRCRSPGAAREHRGRVRSVVATAQCDRTRRAVAPVGFSRRFLGQKPRARSPARRFRCWVRWRTSRYCARMAHAFTCTRWCSNWRPRGLATARRMQRRKRPMPRTSIGCWRSCNPLRRRRAYGAANDRCRVRELSACVGLVDRAWPGRCTDAQLCDPARTTATTAADSKKDWRCCAQPSNRQLAQADAKLQRAAAQPGSASRVPTESIRRRRVNRVARAGSDAPQSGFRHEKTGA